jgi:hypothetical protein
MEYFRVGSRVRYEMINGEEQFFEQEFGEVCWYPYQPPPDELCAARWLRREYPKAHALIKDGYVLLRPPRPGQG